MSLDTLLLEKVLGSLTQRGQNWHHQINWRPFGLLYFHRNLSILYKYICLRLPKTEAYGYLFKFWQDTVVAREKALKELHNTTHEGPPNFMSKLINVYSADPEKNNKIWPIRDCNIQYWSGSDTTAINLYSTTFSRTHPLITVYSPRLTQPPQKAGSRTLSHSTRDKNSDISKQ